MSCIGCSGALAYMPCRVCEIVDNDSTVKATHYCDICSSYICDSCGGDGIRRGIAAAKNFKLEVIEAGKKIVDKIRKAINPDNVDYQPTVTETPVEKKD